MLPDKTIAEYIHKPDLNNTAGIAWGLCTKALDAGGRDNITCIIAKIIKKTAGLHNRIKNSGKGDNR